MRNLNPVYPVPVLITAFSVALLIVLFAWIRSRESRIKSTFALLRRAAILALSFIIVLRPMREESGTDVRLSNTDVIFVLDTTLSMWADDGPNSTRMKAAQDDIREIMEELPGANFALITFQNDATVAAPFTQDVETIRRYIKNIKAPNTDYITGSRMDVPYYDIENMMISSDRKENRQIIIFFLSDGEDTSLDETPYSYEGLATFVDGGAVICYGTEKGGSMQDNYGFTVYSSTSWELGVSHADEDNLERIAEELDVEYIHRERSTHYTKLLEEIMEDSGTVTERNSEYTYFGDTFYKYVPYLLALLALELLAGIRDNAKARKKHGRRIKKEKE
jgi:Ca-activated chloride channel family protein